MVPGTLEQLVAETRWLRRLARALVHDDAAADDLVHDAVLVAAERAPRDRPLRPWLVRVVRNLVRMRNRGDIRRERRERAVAELAAPPPTPDALVDQIELQRLLAGYVIELAHPLRDVVLLHYVEELSSGAIGNRLGIADSTVRWRLKQAVDELRDRLEARAPNRAWIAPVTAFAGPLRGAPVAPPPPVPLPLLALGGVVAIAVVVALAWRALPSVPRQESRGDRSAAARAVREAAPATRAAAAAPAVATPTSPLTSRTEPVRVAGAVLDAAQRPVSDAEVRIRCGYDGPLVGHVITVRTSRDGAFAAEVDAPCRVSVRVLKGGALATTPWERPATSLREPIKLALAPAKTAVLHVVDAETGSPIAGARAMSWNPVEAVKYDEPALDRAVTDGAGVAQVRWADKDTELLVGAPLHRSQMVQLRDESTAVIERTVRLVRGIAVSGHVIGPDGAPAAGVEVTISGPRTGENCMTDASGSFAVAVRSPGSYQLTARGGELVQRAGDGTLDVPAQGRGDIVVQLAPRGVIRGLVVDQHGAPVAGALVRSAANAILPMRTDAAGRFAFSLGERELMLLRGHPPQLIFLVAYHGELASGFHHVDVADDHQDAGVTLQLGPAGIAGVVVDLAGAPIAGADVWLDFCCGAHTLTGGVHTAADAAGRFSFDVPQGSFKLAVRRSDDDDFDDRDDRVVTGGSRDVRLVLP